MSVYRPKKSPYWQFDFILQGHRYYGSTGCKSKRDALSYEAQRRHEILFPKPKGKPPITIDEAAGLRMERVETMPCWPTVRPMLLALTQGLGSNRLLSEIGYLDLQRYVARRRDGRSNASVNREIDEMRAVWKAAARSKFDIGDMPEWGSLYLPVAEKPPRELHREDEQPALETAMPDDLAGFVRFAVLSGWRRAEVMGLRWSDCDLSNMTADTRIKGGNTVRRPLSGSLVAIIANQPKVGPFVFTYVCRKSRRSRVAGERYPLTVGAFRRRWDEARTESEIEAFRFHDLRHTAATRIVRATGSIAAAKEALKHKNFSTTLRYAHVLDEDVREALDKADGLAYQDGSRYALVQQKK